MTAAELRAVGISIPLDIPDEGYVPRRSIRSRLVKGGPTAWDDPVVGSILVEFTVSFIFKTNE